MPHSTTVHWVPRDEKKSRPGGFGENCFFFLFNLAFRSREPTQIIDGATMANTATGVTLTS